MRRSARRWRLGIIPARAGFTVDERRSPDRPPDHPRSRGVYKIAGKNIDNIEGSSPLARGLLARICPVGISGKDHPRSRGVYTWIQFGAQLLWGSSPLARGLLSHRPAVAADLGIIPARAGFTGGVR